MQADTAVVPEIAKERYPFSAVKDANVLVFPSLDLCRSLINFWHASAMPKRSDRSCWASALRFMCSRPVTMSTRLCRSLRWR